jgi:hypothetical protein
MSTIECIYGNGWHSPLDSFFLFSSFPLFALFVSGGQKKKLATQTEPPTLLEVSPLFPPTTQQQQQHREEDKTGENIYLVFK